MKLFTIDQNGKFMQFKEHTFKEGHKESDLENLLENNPEYFFDDAKILIIGRQVATNLNKTIDLLGIDHLGNTVVIELKRGKTPRETLAQLIEYASFIDNLDYEQLNEIFQNYTGEETSLEDYHKEYYKSEIEQETISWNKNSKLVIIASSIAKEISQTALYLRKKGIDVYCLEFKYFLNKDNNKMISSDFVVGEESYIKPKIITNTQLPKADSENFFSNLDINGKKVFTRIFEFIAKNNLTIRWGSKGFSANVKNKSDFIGIFMGWPINSPWGQSIATASGQIEKKLGNSEKIINYYNSEIENLQLFDQKVNFFSHPENKWNIKSVDENKLELMLKIFEKVVEMVRNEFNNNTEK